MRLSSSLVLSFTIALGLLTSGCSSSSGPQPPKPGTPAFAWAGANEAYKKGNFNAVIKNLGTVNASENEFRLRAQIWLIVVDSGVARGEMEWAELMEEGGKVARVRQIDFRKMMNEARTAAGQSAMRVTDIAHKLMPTLKEDKLPVAFGVPDANKDKPVELERIRKGILPQASEVEKLHQLMRSRGVLLSVARFGDAGGDVAKATAALPAAGSEIPRETFMKYLAGELAEMSAVFGPKKLDRAGRARLLLEKAKEALAAVPQSPERAKIQKKIDEQLKKLPKDAN
jgi:hypothetical protein